MLFTIWDPGSLIHGAPALLTRHISLPNLRIFLIIGILFFSCAAGAVIILIFLYSIFNFFKSINNFFLFSQIIFLVLASSFLDLIVISSILPIGVQIIFNFPLNSILPNL